jgi:hypothetical protein
MKNNSVAHLSTKQLQRALSLRERIDAYETELRSVIGTSRPGPAAPVGNPRRRRKNRMTAAGRAALAASMRARWRKAKRVGRGTL